jgi:hypothetical protein
MDPTNATLLLGGVNTLLALSNAAQQRKQQEMQGMMRAAEIEASPWTKMAPQTKLEFSAMNPLGAVAKAGVDTWAQMQALERQKADEEFRKAQLDQMGTQNKLLENALSGGVPDQTKQALNNKSPWSLMGPAK